MTEPSRTRMLIAEDDFISRNLLHRFLSRYGDCDIAVNGKEVVDAFNKSVDEGRPYSILCLDIMMPEMDGQEALQIIRNREKEMGIKQKDELKVVMVTALDDMGNIFKAYYAGGATDYVVKPVDTRKLLDLLKKYGIVD